MKSYWISIFCISLCFSVYAQESNENSDNEPSNEEIVSPTIGFGVGTIGFYGDLNDREYGSPFGANPGFSLFILQPISNIFSIKFNFLYGKIREEERSLQRNVNFESDIRSGAILLEYNFSNFLPEERKVTPFVTTGLEIVEFNPKSDLEAFGGERYNYWSDGTIRNLPENSAIEDQSVIVQRDYSYETDIREAGFNNSTTYSERAISIPVGVGVNLHLTDQIDFRFESIMHFTFTDYIDGITPQTKTEFVDSKKGNANKDYFYYNGVSLSYNFQKIKGADDVKNFDNGEPVDFLASGNTEDFDGDGIIDLIDNCPNTPKDIAVDTLGCPIDTDGDGVPDFKDEEINTEFPEFANDKGIELTNDMIYRSYLNYIDSTRSIAEVVERKFQGGKVNYTRYKLKVGEYDKGETPPNIKQLLQLPGLRKIDQGDKTVYTVGNYKSAKEANDNISNFQNKGFKNIEIVKSYSGGAIKTIKSVDRKSSGKTPTQTKNNTSESKAKTNSQPNNEVVKDQVLFRVQLGAFRNKPTTEKYESIPALKVVESGGFYRYLSGEFSDFNAAAKHKIQMVVDGYTGAFVVAYKNGERVSLKSVGVKSISSDPLIGK